MAYSGAIYVTNTCHSFTWASGTGIVIGVANDAGASTIEPVPSRTLSSNTIVIDVVASASLDPIAGISDESNACGAVTSLPPNNVYESTAPANCLPVLLTMRVAGIVRATVRMPGEANVAELARTVSMVSLRTLT